MTPVELLRQLHDLGATFTPYPDGSLRYRAPKGVLTPALLDAIRLHKVALHDLVEELEERAAIIEHGGWHYSPEEVEAFAWKTLMSMYVVAPIAASEEEDTP